ncbi:hypothetical protein Tco_0772771 [Tanacetum coccineum]|uniref:Uncharacterized protein n=1 Tax=Tanacetum coccineum TaxID=301880 RepID=A0ABQ4ZJ03_9ASTR
MKLAPFNDAELFNANVMTGLRAFWSDGYDSFFRQSGSVATEGKKIESATCKKTRLMICLAYFLTSRGDACTDVMCQSVDTWVNHYGTRCGHPVDVLPVGDIAHQLKGYQRSFIGRVSDAQFGMWQMNLWIVDATGLELQPDRLHLNMLSYKLWIGGTTFVVVSEAAKRIGSQWNDTFLTGDCRTKAQSIPSLFYRRADFCSVRRC